MKGIFTTRVVPDYDDLPERQYHFPRTYLRQVERCVGDWIVYSGHSTVTPPSRTASES